VTSVFALELASTACLLSCLGYVGKTATHRRDHGGGDGALDQRRVNQTDMPVPFMLKNVANRQNRAAEISEDDRSVARVGPADRVTHEPLVTAQTPLGTATGDFDGYIRAGHLPRKLGDAPRQRGAVRDNYDANHHSLSSPG